MSFPFIQPVLVHTKSIMNFKVTKEIKLSEQLFDAQFHPTSDNDLVAAVTLEGNLHLYEAGELKSKIRKHHKGSSIRKVRFTQDGRMVTIARTVKVHDIESNQTLFMLSRNDSKAIKFYSVRPFGCNIICAGDDDGTLVVWDSRAPEEPLFVAHDCEQYISDIDGKYETRKLIVCTSGEGTLTAYDMRAKKMIEPQSELFEAGFQCMKMVDSNKKVVIGGEDGALYVFNQNEWAHTSGKFAVCSDAKNRGKCSIDCIDSLPGDSTFLAGCSDGRIRSVTLWPHSVIGEDILCRRKPLESIHVDQREGKSQMVVTGGNVINFVEFEEASDKEEELSRDETSEGSSDSSTSEATRSPTSEAPSKPRENNAGGGDDDGGADKANKRPKLDNDDYLNLFS